MDEGIGALHTRLEAAERFELAHRKQIDVLVAQIRAVEADLLKVQQECIALRAENDALVLAGCHWETAQAVEYKSAGDGRDINGPVECVCINNGTGPEGCGICNETGKRPVEL